MPSPLDDSTQRTLSALLAETAEHGRKATSQEDWLQLVLHSLVSAFQAKGGAAWLILGKGNLKFAAFSESIAAGTEGETETRKWLEQVALANLKDGQPSLIMPSSATKNQELSTKNQEPLLSVPFRSGDELLGVLELWFLETRNQKSISDLAPGLVTFGAEFGPRLKARLMRDLGAEANRLQRLLQFASDTTGLNNPEQMAQMASVHTRDLLEINRCSILLQKKPGKWSIAGVSGQDSVERRSSFTARMSAFAARHAGKSSVVVKAPALSDPTDPSDPSDLSFFEGSQTASVALIPIKDPDDELIGLLLCESANPDAFGPAGLKKVETSAKAEATLQRGEWMAQFLGKSFASALNHSALPGGKKILALRKWFRRTSAARIVCALVFWSMIAGICLFALLRDVTIKIEGDCSIIPQQRGVVAAEAPGVIMRVVVKEKGDHVEKGAPIAYLDKTRFENELDQANQQHRRLMAEYERHRGEGKEALAHIARLEAEAPLATVRRLQLEIALCELKAPITGTVLTKDIHLLSGEYLELGEPFAELASPDAWDLRIEVEEGDISLIERHLGDVGECPVRFLLYTHNRDTLEEIIDDPSQISAATHEGEKGTFFSITLPGLELSSELQKLMRPGLTGRAKIAVGQSPAITAYTRKFNRWIKMKWFL